MRSLNIIDKAFLLKKTPLFGALDLDLLLSIADKLELVTFQAEERVFQAHHEAHRMYLIVSGRLAIMGEGDEKLAELKVGDFFGDEAIFNEKPRGYTAYCVTKVELLALSRSHLLSIIQECPSVALALLEAYAAPLSFRSR